MVYYTSTKDKPMSAKEMAERSRIGREKQTAEIIKVIKTNIEKQADLGERKCVLATVSYVDHRGLTVSIPCPSPFRNLLGIDCRDIVFVDTDWGRSLKSHFEKEGYTFASHYESSKNSLFFTINW